MSRAKNKNIDEQVIASFRIANMLREARWAKEISADDIFLWVIDSIDLIIPLDLTFFAVLGMQNTKHLQKHIAKLLRKVYEQEIKDSKRKAQKKPELKLDKHMQQIFSKIWAENTPEKQKTSAVFDIDTDAKYLNPFRIMHLCMPYLSDKIKKLLEADDNEYEVIKNTLWRLLEVPVLQKEGFIGFLELLDSMIVQLDLDYSEIANMQINYDHSTTDSAINQMLDAMDSEIVEKSDAENISLETPDNKTKKKEEKKLTIEYFGTDLTKEAKDGYLDPIIGREKEIDQVIYTLLRKTKNNPLLIWEAGVGKTAIVEGLVQRIMMKKVPEKLINKKVFLLDMGTLVAGTKYRGEFESRMKSILEEATDPTNNIILFIDELHTIIGAGGQDQNDAAQMLKPLLSRGKIKLIGATTFDEYQKYIEKDAALKRRFQEVVVNEPSVEVTKQIILGLKQIYEDFHGVLLSDEAIDSAINLSKRYILNKQLPDKALDIIDEACARKSTMQQKLDNDENYQAQEKKIEKIQKKIESAIENQDYFSAAELKNEEEELKKELQKIRSNKNIPINLRSTIEASDIGNVLADKTWIPTNIVNEDEVTKLKRLDAELKKEIVGQNDAVENVVKTLIRSRLSVVKKDKPIGSFLFLGPSGVGKTYLAKLIAKHYFGDEGAMIRFDMSEFMEKFSVSKLIWSPAGYVGYDEWGGLTEAVRRKPYSVILFDEIEKASPDVLNIMLQILDEWQLKDSKGRWIDFKNTIIVMTSNIWTDEFSKKKTTIGFDTWKAADLEDKQFDDIKTRVLEDLKNYITPELSNRIDHKIVFRPLNKENLITLFNQKIKTFLAAWKTNGKVKLPKFSKAEVEKIIDKIYDPQFGARPVERYINDEIEPQIINSLLK
mgnify:FL=1